MTGTNEARDILEAAERISRRADEQVRAVQSALATAQSLAADLAADILELVALLPPANAAEAAVVWRAAQRATAVAAAYAPPPQSKH